MQKILRMRAISPLSLLAAALFVLLALALTPVALRAQTQTTGAITGVVTDPSDAVVPNARVALKDNDRGTTQQTQTSTAGVYRFFLLIPGSYTVTVSASGFATVEQKTDVAVGQLVTVNAKLELSHGKQTLVVTEAATKLQTDNPNLADTISAVQISELPNPGNDMSYIAQTAAGSVMNTNSGYGNFSSYGLPATSNLFTLDGMDDNDPFLNLNNSGATNLMLGQNEIAETSVEASSYTGEYGTLAGANVNFVTKGGTNQFHGNVNYEWNGSAMNSNDWFNNASSTPRPFSNANQWGASIGGPIKKDKAFFFFDTEGLIFLLPTSTPTNVPTPAFQSEVIANLNAAGLSASVPFYNMIFNLYNTAKGVSGAKDVLLPGATIPTPTTPSVPTPDGCSDYAPTTFSTPCALQFRSTAGNESHERIYAGRFDYNFGSKDRMYVRYQQDHGFQATYTDPINPAFNVGSIQPEYQGQLMETHGFGASAVNQLIIFGQWYSAIFVPKSQSAAVATFPATLAFADGSLQMLGGLNYFWPQGRNVTQYGFSDDFSKTHGAHTVKFGFKLRRNDVGDHDYGFYVNPLVLPFSLADFAVGGVGPIGDLIEENFPTTLDLPMATWGMGAYAQDAWKVKPNLTLNLALRIEHNSNPVCQYNCFARLTAQWNEVSHDPDVPYNQALLVNQHQELSGLQSIVWEPRIGFAWQPRGVAHNTVIRGGFGIFGDAFPALVADYMSSNPPLLPAFTIYDDNISPAETSNLWNDAASSNQSFVSGFKAGETVGQIEAANPLFSPPSLTAVDKETHVPTYEKWSMGIEQKFGEHSSFSLSYEGSHGYHETVANGAVNAFVPVSTALPAGFSGLPTAPPDSRFGPVNWITTAGTSSYNGLTASLKSHFHSATVQLNYTWSHSFDTVSNGGLEPYGETTDVSPLVPMNPYNIQLNRADSDYDIRHYLSGSYVWELPLKSLTRGRGPDRLLKGWQVSGTIFTHTGLPFTPYDGSSGSSIPNYDGAQDYANFNGGPVASCSGPYHPCLVATQFSSSAAGFGNVLRNSFRGPGYFDTDFTLMKYINIPHWESARLAVGAQAYNVLNHPNFDNPDANIDSSTFGTVVRTVMPPTSILGAFLGGDASVRMIQLTARLVF
jgi:hypothetical protein